MENLKTKMKQAGLAGALGQPLGCSASRDLCWPNCAEGCSSSCNSGCNVGCPNGGVNGTSVSR